MSRWIPEVTWAQYVQDRLSGMTRTAAARRYRISLATAASFDRGEERSSGHAVWCQMAAGRYPFTNEVAEDDEGQLILRPYELGVATVARCEEARRALVDFDLFRRRYLGEVSRPWHVRVAEAVLEHLDEHGRSYLLINAPPGTGKSTLIRAIGVQATVRNRAIRAARVSNILQLARNEVRLIRRHLERTSPVTQRVDLVRRGLAVDAASTLEHDYGRFKPEGRDLWSMEAFVVAQPEGAQVSEKEPTWSAYGMDSAIIGNRFDLLLGDDLDTPASVRAAEESRRARFDDWDNEIETRLEPDGLIVVLGQRFGARDIYRYLADKRIARDDAQVLDVAGDDDGDRRVYVHLSFPAHHDASCEGLHRRDAPAWGEGGCLLDPYRVPWTEVARERDHNPAKFHTVLQQEDGDPVNTLIEREWIDGSLNHPGCWDRDRRVWQAPVGLANPVGVIQVDPSAVEHWAVQAWCYVPPSPGEDEKRLEETLGHQRILLDVFDGHMTAPDLLEWNHSAGTFHGILEEWAGNYRTLGIPLRHVVVEINAAQRYLLQFEHARRWSRLRQCSFLAHTTGVRKLDERLGVYSLRAPYRYGLVRLPGGDPLSVLACTPLVDELIHFPGRRTDQVMCQWFGEANLATVAPTAAAQVSPRPWRPSWALRGASR